MLIKSIAITLLLAFVAFLPLPLQAQKAGADAVLGVWKNGEGTALVQIYKKDDAKYYGKIVWLKIPNNDEGKPKVDINNPEEKLRSRPLKGMENMRSFSYSGDGLWEDGQIYDPKNGNDYSCKMTLTDPNTL